jgi:PAS domain S-box-containing protein
MMRRTKDGKADTRHAPRHVPPTPPRARKQTSSALLDGEDRFRELVENANDAIALLSPTGIIAFVNRGTERLLGWTRRELLRHHMRKVVTPATLRLVEERTARFMAGERLPSIFDAELLHKDGTVIPVEARARVMRDAAGQIIGYQGIYRDVRERKQSEQRLREREAYFRALSERTADMITIVAANGTIRYVSPSAERILGFTEGEVLGQRGFDFIHPDEVGGAMAQFQELLSTPGHTALVHLRVRNHLGAWRYVEATGANLLDDPLVQGVVINSRDITERMQIEQALRASEERYRRVSESISDYAFSFRLDAHGDLAIEWLTESFTRMTGYTVDELLGTPNPLHRYMHPDDVERVMRTVRALTPGTIGEYEFRICTKAGEVRWMRSRAQVTVEHGKIVRLYGAARDITQERAALAALQEQKAQYEQMVEAAPDVIYTFDPEGTLTSLNAAFTTRTGWTTDEWAHQSFFLLIHHDDAAHARSVFQQLREGKEVADFIVRVRTKEGSYRVGEFRAVPQKQDDVVVGIVGISRDITDREEAKVRLEEHRQLLTRITDTIPELLYLYDLTQHAMTYVNSRVTTLLGYPPEAWIGKSSEGLLAMLHEEDRQQLHNWEERAARLADGELFERDVRMRHVNGAFRWLAIRETVCTRAPDGTAARILGIAEDISARKHLVGQAQTRKIDAAAVGKRLRDFRDELTLTQAEFGAQFGGYDSRQIGTYERGVVDIPMKLLLNIYAQGYPLEKVLGTGTTTLLDETLAYLTDTHRDQRIVEQLIATLHAIFQRDRQKMDRVLGELGIPPKHLSLHQRTLLQLLGEITKQST